MNYESMDCISEGILIERITTSEIIYLNQAMKTVLQVSTTQQPCFTSDILYNDKHLQVLRHMIEEDLKKKGISEGVAYFKGNGNIFSEASFKCMWFDQEDELIMYAFQNPIEICATKELNFQEVAEALPSGVMVMKIEPELSVTYANAEQYKILELSHQKDEFNQLLKYSIYEEDRDWVMTEIYDNLHKNQDVDIEFRMKAKRNRVKWVRLFGRAKQSETGEILFYSSLKDLSMRREINDKLHLERVLFHKIIELTNEVLFRLDLQTNIIYFLGKNDAIFGEKTAIEKFPDCILEMDRIYKEDMNIFFDLVECCRKGIQKNIELRMITKNGEIEWYRIVYNFVKDSEGIPLLVTGKLVNIHEHKILEEQAKIDLLTGFFNKITTEKEINHIMSVETVGRNEHTLFIIDLDNFKAVNDNLGHHFGDIVLKEVARDIQHCFRQNDVFGRIGGDEFIVLMKNCNDPEIIAERAEEVCYFLRKTFDSEENEYSISASVGISIFPNDGKTFEDLYKMADKALYQSKEKGKDCYTQYNVDCTTSMTRIIPNIHDEQRKKYESVDYEVLTTVFNLLHETNDIQLSLKAVIKYLGMTYQVDRCYIYEANVNETQYHLHYQWEKETVVSSGATVIDVSLFQSIFENSNEQGVFYTNNISHVENAKAVQLMEKDEIVSIFLVRSSKKMERNSFIGMDDCVKKRIWKEREVKTLYYTIQVIFSVLNHYNISEKQNRKIMALKKRLQEQ